MARTPEAKVKEEVKAWLRAHGVWFFMPVPTGRGVAGIPDFICCWCGLFVAIETKAPRGRLTPAQKGIIEDIQRAGGSALVVHSAAELQEHMYAYQSIGT